MTTAALRDIGGVRSPIQAAPDGSQPPFSLSLDEMYAARAKRARQRETAAIDAAQQEREHRATARKRFEARQLTDADRQSMLSKIQAAFDSEQQEVMLVSFPSDFCTDGGRRINNRLPGWQETLPAGAQVFLAFWHDALRTSGFGFGARILNFPGGVPGEAGLFITWPLRRA